MTLIDYRKGRGLSQEGCARELGVGSKGHISDIESGRRQASVRLALEIERWSNGKVPADGLSRSIAAARAKPRRPASDRTEKAA